MNSLCAAVAADEKGAGARRGDQEEEAEMPAECVSDMVTIVMSVQDASGRPVDIDRDVLRRSYGGLLQVAQSCYQELRPHERYPEESVALSFQEPQRGQISFTLHARRGPAVWPGGAVSPWQTPFFTLPPEAQQAAEQTAGFVMDLVEAYSFVLAAREARWAGVSGGRSYDLQDPCLGRRLRIPAGVGRALVSRRFDESMRETLLALGRSRVATVCLSPGAGAPKRQMQQVAVATDAAVAFVSGEELPALTELDGETGESEEGPHRGSTAAPTPGAGRW